MVHKEKKKFKYEICNAEFTSKLGIERHTIHKGKKKMKCDICNSNFGLKGDLNSP